MNTIVMNTLNGAVTEYDNFDFHAITPTHAGSALGLYALGGDLDLAATIVSEVKTPKALAGTSKKTKIEIVFVAVKGSGTSELTVYGESVSYDYPFRVLAGGVSRVVPGKGFRENYFAFGYSNTDGADFQLDRIEAVNYESAARRTA